MLTALKINGLPTTLFPEEKLTLRKGRRWSLSFFYIFYWLLGSERNFQFRRNFFFLKTRRWKDLQLEHNNIILHIIPTLYVYEGYIVSVHSMVRIENRPVDPGSIQRSHRPISFTRIKHRTRANGFFVKLSINNHASLAHKNHINEI